MYEYSLQQRIPSAIDVAGERQEINIINYYAAGLYGQLILKFATVKKYLEQFNSKIPINLITHVFMKRYHKEGCINKIIN